MTRHTSRLLRRPNSPTVFNSESLDRKIHQPQRFNILSRASSSTVDENEHTNERPRKVFVGLCKSWTIFWVRDCFAHWMERLGRWLRYRTRSTKPDSAPWRGGGDCVRMPVEPWLSMWWLIEVDLGARNWSCRFLNTVGGLAVFWEYFIYIRPSVDDY